MFYTLEGAIENLVTLECIIIQAYYHHHYYFCCCCLICVSLE